MDRATGVVRPRKLCALDRSAVTRYTTIRVLLNHRGAKVFENDRTRDGFAHAAFTRYVFRQPLIERRLDTCFFSHDNRARHRPRFTKQNVVYECVNHGRCSPLGALISGLLDRDVPRKAWILREYPFVRGRNRKTGESFFSSVPSSNQYRMTNN